MKSINKAPTKPNKFDGIVLGDEHKEDEKTEYVCSGCNISLVRLSDRNNQSESWFCRKCSIEFDSEDEKIRHKLRLSIPAEDIEPAISTTPGIDYNAVAIRHEPEIKGGLKSLQQRGLRITHYEEHIPK